MKYYEKPIIEDEEFEIEDVIATSLTPNGETPDINSQSGSEVETW